MTDDDTPTNYAPTELAASVTDTEAHTAWSLEEYVEPERRTWPIVALAVAGAVVAIAIASGLALHHARQPQLGEVAMVAPSVKAEKPDVPEVGPSGFEIPPPPPPSTVTQTVAAPGPRVIPPKPPLSGPLPDLMPSNAQFIGNLRQLGWTIPNNYVPTAIQRGHEACQMLREGEPPDLMARKLIAVETQLTMAMALQFIDTVSTTYPNCP